MLKQKSKSVRFLWKSFCGVKTFLSIFFLGSSVFASGFSLSSQPVVQPPKKDISVFVSKLSERLQGVFGELLNLSSSVSRPQTSEVSGMVSSVAFLTGGLQDLANSLYKDDIYSLAKYGVIDAQRSKFYPDNYLRKYEMIMMVVKYKLAQQNQQFPQIVFSTRGWFADVAQNVSYAPYVAYADQQGWLKSLTVIRDEKKFFAPNDFLAKQDVCAFLAVSCDDLDSLSKNITRGEFVHLLMQDSSAYTSSSVPVSSQDDSSQGPSLFSSLQSVFAFSK